jgi:hypothetical protein
LEPARSRRTSIDGFIIVSWREAMGVRAPRVQGGWLDVEPVDKGTAWAGRDVNPV